MSTRIVESLTEGKWIVQFQCVGGWTQLGDEFDTQQEAEEFEQEQIDTADYSNGED